MCADDLHHFRLLQRRFIVYKPSKAASPSCRASTGESPHPSMRSQTPAVSAQADKKEAAADADSATAGEQKTHCVVRASDPSLAHCSTSCC